jgi:hypothetical protein
VAEPLGITHAVSAVVSTSTRFVEIITDHMGMVWASKARYAKGRQYNECIATLKTRFPRLLMRAGFIPGSENIVPDKLSRGVPVPVEFGTDLSLTDTRLLGDDLAWVEHVKGRTFDLAKVEDGNLVAPVWMR